MTLVDEDAISKVESTTNKNHKKLVVKRGGSLKKNPLKSRYFRSENAIFFLFFHTFLALFTNTLFLVLLGKKNPKNLLSIFVIFVS